MRAFGSLVGAVVVVLIQGFATSAPVRGANDRFIGSGGGGGGGTVAGQVKFIGKAPQNPALDMSEEPKCEAKYKKAPLDPIVAVNPNGTLANVFVYISSGLPPDAAFPAPTTAVVLNQEGCLYSPRVFGIMVGQPLEIRNSDPLLHNIKSGGKKNRPFNISQPTAGMTLTRTF